MIPYVTRPNAIFGAMGDVVQAEAGDAVLKLQYILGQDAEA